MAKGQRCERQGWGQTHAVSVLFMTPFNKVALAKDIEVAIVSGHLNAVFLRQIWTLYSVHRQRKLMELSFAFGDSKFRCGDGFCLLYLRHVRHCNC
jgi:hypothetical protein